MNILIAPALGVFGLIVAFIVFTMVNYGYTMFNLKKVLLVMEITMEQLQTLQLKLYLTHNHQLLKTLKQ